MFVDFNKVFGKTPQTELKIPQALIDQLSSKLPDGLIYVVDSNNNLTISHDGKKDQKYTISGMTLEPTDQQKEILGDDFSFDDIMNLSYNSQKPVPVRFKDDKYVNINGTDISIEQLSYNPFKPDELVIVDEGNYIGTEDSVDHSISTTVNKNNVVTVSLKTFAITDSTAVNFGFEAYISSEINSSTNTYDAISYRNTSYKF